MLARRLTTILPNMTLAEAIETTRIHCVAGNASAGAPPPSPPGRVAPRQPMADVRLLGGGQVPTPGEGRGPITVSSSWMSSPSASGMCLKCCGNP